MWLLVEVLYLFGGWDGSKSLADLWRYDINSAQWEQLSSDTSIEVRESHHRSSLSTMFFRVDRVLVRVIKCVLIQ